MFINFFVYDSIYNFVVNDLKFDCSNGEKYQTVLSFYVDFENGYVCDESLFDCFKDFLSFDNVRKDNLKGVLVGIDKDKLFDCIIKNNKILEGNGCVYLPVVLIVVKDGYCEEVRRLRNKLLSKKFFVWNETEIDLAKDYCKVAYSFFKLPS